MASRENQGLQIALIICAILIAGLGISTYLCYTSSKEETAKAAAAVKDATDSKQSMTKAVEDASQLKQLMGYGPKDDSATIQANYKKDLDTYAATMAESERNYRNVVVQLATELQKKNGLLVEAESRNQQLQAEIKTNEKTKKGEIDTYDSGLKTAQEDIKSAIGKFDEERNKFKKQTAELSRKVEGKTKDFDEQMARSTKEQDELTSLLSESKKNQGILTGKLQEREKSAEMSDGKVTWVNQGGRLVWLNLGADDGLRKQISFDVIGADETKLIVPEKDSPDADKRKGNIKANIEVIRVLDHHLAEARIMQDDPSVPIMPGDQLYSAAWRPNHPEHFALVGRLDLDKNGTSDLEKIKNLITINGGIIDAELRDDGKRVGKITADTRYLVVGKEPNGKEGPEYEHGYTEMMSEAKVLPVKMITLDYLIAYLGYKDHERTVPLGADAKASDFKPRNPADVTKRRLPDPTRERREVPAHPQDRAY